MWKTDKTINFDQIQLNLSAILIICCPQKFFSIKLQPADPFSFGIWLSDQFELETPAQLIHTSWQEPEHEKVEFKKLGLKLEYRNPIVS
jgi:hypothetical protein